MDATPQTSNLEPSLDSMRFSVFASVSALLGLALLAIIGATTFLHHLIFTISVVEERNLSLVR